VAKLPNTTPLTQLGFTATELKRLSPRVRKLTRSDLIALVEKPDATPAKLNLTFQDLQGLHALAASAAKKSGTTTGGGGSGDGGIRCCCCIACCCCCCAVSVTQSESVAAN
jgi:hypothetical protein